MRTSSLANHDLFRNTRSMPLTLAHLIEARRNALIRCLSCCYWRAIDPAQLMDHRLAKGRSIDLADIARDALCLSCNTKGRVTITPTMRPCTGPLARARGIDRSKYWRDEFAEVAPSGRDLERMS